MWIARCKGGLLYLFDNVPVKHEEGYWTAQRGYYEIELDSRLFREVTWENSPKKVKFELVEEDLVEKACKWLQEDLYNTCDSLGNKSFESSEYYTVEEFIEAFRKAMKDEKSKRTI